MSEVSKDYVLELVVPKIEGEVVNIGLEHVYARVSGRAGVQGQ